LRYSAGLSVNKAEADVVVLVIRVVVVHFAHLHVVRIVVIGTATNNPVRSVLRHLPQLFFSTGAKAPVNSKKIKT